MFSHVIVGSNDLERAKAFYDAVLGTLGIGAGMPNAAPSGHRRYFYLHDGGLFGITEPIDGQPATVANGATLGFRAATPEQAKAFHDTAIAHGGTTIEDPPGPREGALGKMYLSYVRDLDGNKLCAIYRVK